MQTHQPCSRIITYKTGYPQRRSLQLNEGTTIHDHIRLGWIGAEGRSGKYKTGRNDWNYHRRRLNTVTGHTHTRTCCYCHIINKSLHIPLLPCDKDHRLTPRNALPSSESAMQRWEYRQVTGDDYAQNDALVGHVRSCFHSEPCIFTFSDD